MSRICAFYSVGPHYASALRALRRHYPSATLVALVPSNYDVAAEVRGLADELEQTERSHYAPRDISANIRLVRRIRATRYDAFAVIFDSPQLRLLAALSGARERFHCTEDGRVVPLRESVAGVLFDTGFRALRGRLTYLILWTTVRLLPVHCRRSR